MNAGTTDYVGVIRRLPRPTLAQTERFARFVSCAHSWYKHLPVDPKVPFVFYLDPGAGMSRVHTRTAETALVEITDESPRFHYTWQTTRDYRRRFGHWNYHADYGTSFLFAGEGGVVSTAGSGLAILTDSGEWAGVPAALVASGTAHVSALVHPSPKFLVWACEPARFRLTDAPHPQDARFQPPANLVLGRLWGLLQRGRPDGPGLAEVCQSVPPQAMGLVQQALAGPQQPDWFWPTDSGWDWPEESWLEQLQGSGVEAGLLPSVVKYVEVERLRLLTVAMCRQSGHESLGWMQGSLQWPTEAVLAVAEAIPEERGRQLAAMTAAMARFVVEVFPA
jgi:hypothetical protein